jgi:hypothetical protein
VRGRKGLEGFKMRGRRGKESGREGNNTVIRIITF